jgi:hypothetical protein
MTYEQNKMFDIPTVIYTHKTPKDISVDGEYTIEKIGNSDATNIMMITSMGKHTVTIKF